MLAESGAGGLALRQLAAAEGTSTTAIYSMFEDRSGLILAVGHTASLGFVAAQRAVPVTHDPYADLLSLGRAYRQWALDHPALYVVLMTSAVSDVHLAGPIPEAEAAEPLREVIVRLIGAGIFPPLDPNMMLGNIWASVHGFVSLELDGYFMHAPQEDLDEMYEAQLNSIGRGWRTTS